MNKSQQQRRILFLAGCMVILFAGVGYRLVDLQVLRHEELEREALKNTRRAVVLEPKRGDILDARGNVLAMSLPVKTVCANPSLVGKYHLEIANAVSPLLQMPATEISEMLSKRWRTNKEGVVETNTYVVLKRKVPMETWSQIQKAMGSLQLVPPGLKLTKAEERFYQDLRSAVFADRIEDQMRFFPGARQAAHVLGFVGMKSNIFNGQPLQETAGVEGIEYALNRELTGVRGWRVTELDKRKNEIVFLREQDVKPTDGLNVVLTLDSGVQLIAEQEISEAARHQRPDSISCVIVRPRTGEIVAMAVLPTFDPNEPGESSPGARKNRVITDANEPGSTFKAAVVCGALHDKIVDLDDVIFCENGAFSFAGRVLHDHKRYGSLSVESVITKSSNIGAAKIGIKLGEQRLYEHIKNFGFGARTGIVLPGESPGLVYQPKDWYKVSIAQIPMGHGLMVTRLQMVMAMSAIANQGKLMRPMIVSRLVDREGKTVAEYRPNMVRQVVSPEASVQMVKALKTVVGKEGTAAKAKLEHYTAAGKTGTAQAVENGAYSHDKYYSSFIGFFPADNPELCISVVMDNPKEGHYGGEICGPVFARIAERVGNYLSIRPDIEEAEVGPDKKQNTKKNKPLVAAARNKLEAAN